MAELITDANRDRFLTAHWNNVITLALGIPALVFAYFALVGDAFSDFTTFIGLVIAASFF